MNEQNIYPPAPYDGLAPLTDDELRSEARHIIEWMAWPTSMQVSAGQLGRQRRHLEKIEAELERRRLERAPLFWNESGCVNCAGHAPRRDGDIWKAEGWRQMTAAEVKAWKTDIGSDARCECCGPFCGPNGGAA